MKWHTVWEKRSVVLVLNDECHFLSSSAQRVWKKLDFEHFQCVPPRTFCMHHTWNLKIKLSCGGDDAFFIFFRSLRQIRSEIL